MVILTLLGWGGVEGRGYGFTLPIPATPPSAEYPILSGNYTDPRRMVLGPDGNVYIAEAGSAALGRISPSGVITLVPGLTSGATGITIGSDGKIWVTEANGKIGKVSLSGTGAAEYLLPASPARNPQGIVAGPDGNLWFCEPGVGAIGQCTLSGSITEFAIPSTGATPTFITVGSDGNLWCNDGANNGICRITTAGIITEYTAGITPGSNPQGITSGTDGNVWFVESGTRNLAKITTGIAAGTVTEYPGTSTSTTLGDLTIGDDGSFWFIEISANRVGHLTNPGTSPVITEYSSSYVPAGICRGANSDIWFSEYLAGVGSQIAHIVVTAQPNYVSVSASSIVGGQFSSFCPSTPEGISSLMTQIRQLGPRKMIHAYLWDAATQLYTPITESSPLTAQNIDSGIFIGASASMSFAISGTAQVAPFGVALKPGWNFIGIPPLIDGPIQLTNHPLNKFTLYDATGAAITGLARDAAIGAVAYYWDGLNYRSTTVLETGKAYWINNSLSQQLRLTRVNTTMGGVVFLSDRESSAGAAPTAASSSPSLLPPPIPAFADIQQQHGCGSGGAAAVMIGLLAMLGVRQRGQRQRVG